MANALKKGDRKSLDEAIEMYRQSLKMLEHLYGETKPHPEVAIWLTNLAMHPV